ncbi:MAG: hypothetical protein H7X93_08160, partial [Sphingomonadaceae bacterium]|nr:hypothetical protein [Sphingomonadaceae bacterium]
MSAFSARDEVAACFAALGLGMPSGSGREARSPIDGSVVATLDDASDAEIDAA